MKTVTILLVVMIGMAGLVHSRAACAQASTAAEEWQQLGTRIVDYTLDYDAVPITYKKGVFTTLKIKVNEGTITMHRCMITFENGEKQEIEIKHQFTAGSEKIVDLKGNSRIIEKVTFWYDTKNKSSQKAVVEVWGKK
jgi:Protein of unknown function (DUF2541)